MVTVIPTSLFNLASFPDPREVLVRLGSHWDYGGPCWVYMALSSIKLITSPCLAVVKLGIFRPPNGAEILGPST